MATKKKIYLGGYIRKAIKKKAIESAGERTYEYFHPSQFADCSRKLIYYYEYDKAGKNESFVNIDPDVQRKFDNGHYMHDRYSDYVRMTGKLLGCWECKSCGKVVGRDVLVGIPDPELTDYSCTDCGDGKFKYREVRVNNDEYQIAGSVDAVFDNGDELIVVDFKSIKFSGFSDLPSKGPSPAYIVQIQIYMWLLGLNKGIILYECKDDQRTKEYEFERDESIIDGIKDKAKFLIALRDKGQLPKRKYEHNNGFECKYCPFVKECWGSEPSSFGW